MHVRVALAIGFAAGAILDPYLRIAYLPCETGGVPCS